MTHAIATNVPFAFTLFTWIRQNKKALYARLQVEDLQAKTAQQSLAIATYRDLKNRFAGFEARYRGAQKWLSGTDAPEFYAGNAQRAAVSLIHHVLACQASLQDSPDNEFNALWQSFRELPGMSEGMFSNLTVQHIGHDRMPALASAFPHASVDYKYEHQLEIIFTNGEASRTINKSYAVPAVAGMSLGEQIEALNKYWAGIREFARAELKNAANWPPEAESLAIEKRRVTELADTFIKGLSTEKQALIKKHPDVFRAVFNKHF